MKLQTRHQSKGFTMEPQPPQPQGWEQYVDQIPDEVVRTKTLNARSLWIEHVTGLLIKSYERFKNTDKRAGLVVPLAEVQRVYPKDSSLGYLVTRFRQIGLRLRVQRVNGLVHIYIDGYTKQFSKLKNQKGLKNAPKK